MMDKTQDSRKLRRYRRRWKSGHFFAWFGNILNVVVSYERDDHNIAGFVKLGCIINLLPAYF